MIPNNASAGGQPPFTVVHAASEVVGFAKTGGLADVVGSLPPALAQSGLRCAVFLPLYRSVRQGRLPLTSTPHTFTVPMGDKQVAGRLFQSQLQGSSVPVYLVEQPDYYERDDPDQGRGLYQFTRPDGKKADYLDNCERFAFFCRAVLESLRLLDLWPDVLQVHDWQTGLVPVYLKEEYARRSEDAVRRRYQRIRTLFTIHNLAYQGVFWHHDMDLLRLDWRLFNFRQLEFHDHISFLKAGLVFADLLNTVSPTYAREIQTPYYGCGLHGVLAERNHLLHGIVNGVDYRVWDPATDPHLAVRFDVTTVGVGKPKCKAFLQQEFGLDARPEVPLLGIVSRLVDQKGVDLILKSAERLLGLDTQLVVLGEGDPAYHRAFLDLQKRFPRRVAVTLGQDWKLAHQIEGGADLFLMPSQYEPCGLNQLYSLKYGTVPVVRVTGGLADTVVDATDQTLGAGTATGFAFIPYTPTAFLETVQRALALYRGRPERWLALMQTGMRQDWSWDRSAAEYQRLYEKIRLKS